MSAETYLGARGIVEALGQGADVVITGRVADGCLYLGPLAHEFGWDFDDHHAMARGMVIGHLMECGCQVTGGYFADPGFKDVPDIANLGNPIADVSATSIVISKLDGTGGVVSMETCKEQLLYEVLDPSSYYCPDVVVDFNQVSFRQIGQNQVEVHADAAGKARTSTLKALIGVREGYVAEEMVLFAGPGAMARAELTREILEARFARVELKADEIRMDYVGHNSVHREASPPPAVEPYEVVLRVAVKTASRHEAAKLRREVDPLAVNGPAATGKWGTSAPGARVRACVGLNSCLVPRDEVAWTVTIHTVDRGERAVGMLAILGIATIGIFLVLVVATRTPVIAALILTPLAAAVAGGFGHQVGAFAIDGLKTVAPVAALMLFAVLYFGLDDRRRPLRSCRRASARARAWRRRQTLPGDRGPAHAGRVGR